MFGISMTRTSERTGVRVVAQLNARLQPLDRGDIFEDPLDDTLQDIGLGEVTGGGTLQSNEGWVQQCDIEMDLPEADPETLRKIADRLEALGAPKGSKLLVEETGTEMPFGKSEGLAIYLNGTDLEDWVYQKSDVNYVIAELDRLLGTAGKYCSYWDGPTETALYIYGPSADAMRELIVPLIDTYPLCEGARIEQIA
jgi:hypothetical protein